MSGPLHGLRVVELADEQAEFAGKLMADMGADVIKVEPPEGSPTRQIGPFVDDVPGLERSLHFWHYNTSKKSVTADLTTREGRCMWLQLVAGADIVLETTVPGTLDELGVGWQALSTQNPRLIMVSVTPWGPDGPYAGYASGDLIQMAMGGIVHSCGYDDHDLPPMRPGENHAWHLASWQAVIGALTAIHSRDREGAGQHVDVAVHDCVSVCTEFAATHWFYSSEIIRRRTARHAGAGRVPAGVNMRSIYPARNDRWALLSGVDAAAMDYLMGWGEEAGVDLSKYQDENGRLTRGPESRAAVEAITSIIEADELWLVGQSMGRTWGSVRRPEDWLDDPHAAERGFFHEIEHPEHPHAVKHPGPPYAFTRHPGALSRAPLLGEHNAEVYGRLGYSPAELTVLREQSVI